MTARDPSVKFFTAIKKKKVTEDYQRISTQDGNIYEVVSGKLVLPRCANGSSPQSDDVEGEDVRFALSKIGPPFPVVNGKLHCCRLQNDLGNTHEDWLNRADF